jgi:hypothetical protein
MEIHKALGIPVLNSSVPYATAPAARDEVFILYTRRENGDSRILGSWGVTFSCLLSFGVFFLGINAGWSYFFPVVQGGSVSTGMYFVLSLVIVTVFSLWCLFFGTREIELHVNHSNGEVQVRRTKQPHSSVLPGAICTHSTKLVQNRSATSTKSILGVRHEAHLVVVHVGTTAMIMGAFKSAESAMSYAETVQQETRLPFTEIDDERFEHSIGFWAYGREDQWALNQLK